MTTAAAAVVAVDQAIRAATRANAKLVKRAIQVQIAKVNARVAQTPTEPLAAAMAVLEEAPVAEVRQAVVLEKPQTARAMMIVAFRSNVCRAPSMHRMGIATKPKSASLTMIVA